MDESVVAIDPGVYRRVLGQYPTGVCVITADDPEAGPSGMVVGSFTSVSLDPPLVAFFPTRASPTWPKIERAGSFCVNILASEQEDVCRAFFGGEKFSGVTTTPAGSGSPIIDGTLAWIDCDIEDVQDAGDHLMVLGRVRSLAAATNDLPLLFFQGGYGKFASLSMSAADVDAGLTASLRAIDIARPLMERFASEYGCRITASARSGDDVVILSSAGHASEDREQISVVGQRTPYSPPMASVFAAFGADTEEEQWLARSKTPGSREKNIRALDLVRSRGVSLQLWSHALREFDAHLREGAQSQAVPDARSLEHMLPHFSYNPLLLDDDTMRTVRQVAAPVFDSDGNVAYALAAFGFGRNRAGAGLGALVDGLLDLASVASRRIGGRVPEQNEVSANGQGGFTE